MRGQFVIYPDTPEEIIVRNTVLPAGMELYLKQIFNTYATVTDYYCGLMGEAYDQDTELSDIVGVTEPTIGTNGYAREELARDTTDWPDIAAVNGVWRARSRLMTFTAAGGNFDKLVYRLFLASVAAGSAGDLFAVSGAFSAPRQVTPAAPLPVKYELWMPQ